MTMDREELRRKNQEADIVLYRKIAMTGLFLLGAALLSALVLIAGYYEYNMLWDTDEIDKNMTSFAGTYEIMDTKSVEVYQALADDMIDGVELYASAIRESGIELKTQEIFEGYILSRVSDDLAAPVEVPEGFPVNIEIDGYDLSLSDSAVWNSRDKSLIYAKIRDGYYYAELVDRLDRLSDNDIVNQQAALDDYAKSTECEFLLLVNIEAGDPHDSDLLCFAGTGIFKDCEKASDIALTYSDLETAWQKGSSFIKINGQWWIMYARKSDNDGSVTVMLDPVSNYLTEIAEEIIAFYVILLMICVPLAVWITTELRRGQKKSVIGRRAAAFLLAGAILTGGAAAFVQSIIEFTYEASTSNAVLSAYTDRLNDDRDRTDTLWKSAQNRYIGNAKRMAAAIDEFSNLQSRKWLAEAAKLIDADYITIYDRNGKEIISSDRYRGLVLGENSDSATYDFRRLLRGVREISHGNVTDEITGLTRDYHGISLRYNSDDEAYGVMLIAAAPDAYDAVEFTDINDVSSSMAPVGGVLFGIDPETQKIVYSSEAYLIDSKATEVGLSEKEVKDDYRGFINISGLSYYDCSAENEGIIFNYAYLTRYMLWYTAKFSVISAALFVIIAFAMTMLLIRYVYRERDLTKPAIPETETLSEKAIEKRKKLSYIEYRQRNRTSDSNEQYGITALFDLNQTPTARTIAAVKLMITIAAVYMTILFFSRKAQSVSNMSVVQYIAHGEWQHGFNLFAFAAIFFALCMLIVALAVIRLVFTIISNSLGGKKQTICDLTGSLFQYAAILLFFFNAFTYLGVDVKTILASLGLVGFALSLAAKDVLADVIAGFTILATGIYETGDIIEVQGFQGEVGSLGVRRTELRGRGGNIKSFRNSQINDVINYSRMTSWYPLMLTVSSSYSLEEIEEILNKELPLIGEKYEEIISGPEYVGVESFNEGSITLQILTECEQSAYSRVQRVVNREIRLLVDKYEIKLH